MSARTQRPAGPEPPRTDDWRNHAACRRPDVEPELWFTRKTRAQALHICQLHCPVLKTCQLFARNLRPAPTDCVMGGIPWRAYYDSEYRPHPPEPTPCQLCRNEATQP